MKEQVSVDGDHLWMRPPPWSSPDGRWMDPNPQDPGWVHEDGDHTTRSVVRGLSLVPGVAQLQRCWLWDNSSMLVPTTRGLDPQGPCAVLATTRSPGCEVEVEESTTNHEQTSRDVMRPIGICTVPV